MEGNGIWYGCCTWVVVAQGYASQPKGVRYTPDMVRPRVMVPYPVGGDIIGAYHC